MDSTTSIPAFWKSLTYSKVDWYTLAVRYQRERGGVHVGGPKERGRREDRLVVWSGRDAGGLSRCYEEGVDIGRGEGVPFCEFWSTICQ